jgi:hypothetical protein
MTMNSRNRTIGILVALSVTSLLGWGGYSWWSAEQDRRATQAIREHAANAFQDIGVLPKTVDLRLREIGDRTKQNGVIRDQDLAYCIKVFEEGPSSSTDLNWHTLAFETSFPLAYAKAYSPSQFKAIETFADHLIAKDGCQAAALIMLRRCRSPHRSNYFESLVKSPKPEVSAVAQRMLDAEKKDGVHTS